MAAQTILAAKGRYDRAHLDPYARQLTARFGASVVGRVVRRALPAAASHAAARWLMATPWFTRQPAPGERVPACSAASAASRLTSS